MQRIDPPCYLSLTKLVRKEGVAWVIMGETYAEKCMSVVSKEIQLHWLVLDNCGQICQKLSKIYIFFFSFFFHLALILWVQLSQDSHYFSWTHKNTCGYGHVTTSPKEGISSFIDHILGLSLLPPALKWQSGIKIPLHFMVGRGIH